MRVGWVAGDLTRVKSEVTGNGYIFVIARQTGNKFPRTGKVSGIQDGATLENLHADEGLD